MDWCYSYCCDGVCSSCYRKEFCYEWKSRNDSTSTIFEILNHNVFNKGFNYRYVDNDIIVDVPGFSKEDISLTIQKSKICLDVKQKDTIDTYMEIPFDQEVFSVDSAVCDNGQLKIKLKKNEEKVQEIEVK